MRIRAQLRCMADSEIVGMIPPDVFREIKAKDSHPMFKAFVVGHEGEAKGNLVGVGNIIKRWFGDAIKKLHGKISAGIRLFHGHAETNTNEGRVPIGEIVGKKLMDVKDKLSSVVACWIYPNYRHLPLDVASIEADVDFEQNPEGSFIVADVEGVTGIALGNSAVDIPGFAGATLLGEFQAFAEKHKLVTESRPRRLLRTNNTDQLEELKLVGGIHGHHD